MKPIEDLARRLRYGVSHHVRESVGTIGDEGHARLCSPPVVIEGRLHEFDGAGGFGSNPGKAAAQVPIPLDPACNHLLRFA
jgi:hypothetical protein